MIYEVYQKPFPVMIIDEHYILREQSDDDTQPFFNYYCNDQDVTRFIWRLSPLPSKKPMLKFITAVICFITNAEFIGLWRDVIIIKLSALWDCI